MTDTANVRYPEWVKLAVERFRVTNGYDDFSKAVKFLIEESLNRYGYYRYDYEPHLKDFPLTDDLTDPKLKISESEKRYIFEIKKRDAEIERLMLKINEIIDDGVYADYSNSNIGNNSANIRSSITTLTLADGLGFLGNVKNETRGFDVEQKKKVLKAIKAIKESKKDTEPDR